MTDESGSEDYVSIEYELPAAMDGVPNHFAPHRLLFEFLKLDLKDVVLVKIFRILAGICDPMTQPEDSDELPLSVDLLSQLVIALSYDVVLQGRREDDPRPWEASEKDDQTVDIETIRFAISTKFHMIVLAISKAVKADDELRVRYLHNDWKNWTETSKYWLPDLNEDQMDPLLKLAYYICPVALMGLYRLFVPPNEADYNAALNPYSESFIRLWKTHTDIVALGLEMDRELEEEAWTNKNDNVDTPDLVKRVLLGSSAVRTVLAWILERTLPSNGKFLVTESLDHDVRHKTLLTFYDPLARSATNCGSISHDQHLLVVALILLRCRSPFTPCWHDKKYLKDISFPCFDSEDLLRRVARRRKPLQATGDLMVDMYYRDQFDEDVKYVFGYYDSDEDDESDKSSGADSLARRGIAIRATGNEQEFDEEGRDWRDCPRGENVNFTEEFLKLEALVAKLSNSGESDYFFASWFELSQALEFLALTQIESVDSFMVRVGQVAIHSIAKAVKDEYTHTDSKIVLKEIYRYFVSPAKFELLSRVAEDFTILPIHPVTNFEVILLRNPYCALAILDELFMCNGLRRSLIWFLTNHVNPLMTLISYMYEFVAGARGNSTKREIKYLFSRVGPLEISKMEQLMMLHELFSAADKWLSDEDENTRIGELNCLRLVSYLCLMIKRLLEDGIIRSNQADVYEDYSHEIQLLLFNWIGKFPEAREIFFKIKLEKYGLSDSAANESEALNRKKESKASEKKESASTKSQGLSEVEDCQIVANVVKYLESMKGLDDVAYAVKCLEPDIRDTFVCFADILVDHIYEVFVETELSDSEVPKALEPPTPEFDDIQVFLTNFNALNRNLAFVDRLVARLAGWIVDTRGENPDQEENDFEFQIASPHPEPEVLLQEVADSEFSDAFLNGEEPFQSKPKGKKSKKKSKSKRRGKK